VTTLGLGYPILVYWAVTHGISWVVPVVISAFCLQRFYHSHYEDWKFLIFAVCLWVGAIYFQTFSAKVMPIIMHGALFFVFYNTLSSQSSLIERFARLDFPELPPRIPEYCRQVTQVWCAFFALNIVICSALALWATDAQWAWYNGFIIYLLLGGLMSAEYIVRRLRFPWLETKPIKESMMNMIQNGHTVWNRDRH